MASRQAIPTLPRQQYRHSFISSFPILIESKDVLICYLMVLGVHFVRTLVIVSFRFVVSFRLRGV